MDLDPEHLSISTRPIEPQKSNAKKRYAAPKFAVLDREQAKRALAARALAGDDEAERMLKLIAEQGIRH
jgi:hypothetical protein